MKRPTPKRIENTARAIVRVFLLKAHSNAGIYIFLIQAISLGSLSVTFPDRKRLANAGAVVNERIKAERTAMAKVDAIGMNIFPSTPVKANTGKKTITI